MDDLTPEALAAWREELEAELRDFPGEPETTRILALLDALAEAERALSSALEASECNHLAKIEWFHRAEKAEGELAKVNAERDKLRVRLNDSLHLRREQALMLVETETQRDKYLTAYSEMFEQRDEYLAECKRLWPIEEQVKEANRSKASVWSEGWNAARSAIQRDHRAAFAYKILTQPNLCDNPYQTDSEE